MHILRAVEFNMQKYYMDGKRKVNRLMEKKGNFSFGIQKIYVYIYLVDFVTKSVRKDTYTSFAYYYIHN